MSEQENFSGWAIVELMGHRRLAGFVREVSVAGAGMLRVDIPTEGDGEPNMTQLYPPSSLYCMTPTTEVMARAVARANKPEPVHSWELPRALPPALDVEVRDDDEDDVNDPGKFEEAERLIHAFGEFAPDTAEFHLLPSQRDFCHNFIIATVEDPDLADFMRGGLASGRTTAFELLERFYASITPAAGDSFSCTITDSELGVTNHYRPDVTDNPSGVLIRQPEELPEDIAKQGSMEPWDGDVPF
jgi:hypothetical protein